MEKKIRVLIADDALDTVELLKKRLRFEGYETLEAYDGEQCLEQASKHNPDIIILDIMMPKLDGYEVCRRLKANRSTAYIPILMLTAKGDVEDKIKGLDVGAHDYMPKPFDYKELSARVKSLLTIKSAREKLVQEEKSEALDHMMDELAHELRNPLTSIGGFSRRVYDNLPEGDPNRAYVGIILKEVSRLEKMVKHLVELKTTAITYKEPNNINRLIAEVLDEFQQEFSTRGIETGIELADGLPLLPVDDEHFKLAIKNIIENSVEALQKAPQKSIRVCSKVEQDWVEIHILDSGKGIPKDKIKNIFDPFFTSKTSGPGLGLTIALKIIQEHQGTISVTSEPGEGSFFVIKLPIRRPQDPSAST
ncbi:response regulator [Desulfoferrobacter suflitae]|uniref:response regulator n=1 Tax=Desulfoferrobacter suflitae TaxID=2865782 RepID=UPI0021649900|nr:response regulator [Desulfoferrobacter suflitae]MCK8603577.1 response regulator [Desulfoferrobacter suflitae]